MTTIVYALRCPIDNKIRYIGQTHQPYTRFKQHLRDTVRRGKKSVWLKRLKIYGMLPKMEVLENCHSKERALKREKAFIEKHKDTVYNYTD